MASSGTATVVEKLREAQGDKMSHDELVSNLRVLLVAGTDTTSKVLSWALYYLAQDAELRDKVSGEVQQQLPVGVVSLEELDALRLVKAVWLEALRVKGPAPFDAFNNDEEITIAGRSVPPRTEIYILYRYLLHNAPEVRKALGTDLEKFRPERWLTSSGEIVNVTPFDTLPFGHGPRICLGMRLADYEGRLAIAKIFQRFRLNQWQGPDLKERTTFVLEPAEDVKIGVEVRT